MNQIQLPETYAALSDFRKNDVYLPEMNQAQLIADFFPGTFTELTQRLSDITGAFYGGMLKQIGKLYGAEAIEQLSSTFMYDLGSRMTLRNLEAKPNLQPGIPAVAKILMGAVFTSSPEYNFEFKELNDYKCELLIKGVDRYHKITHSLQIAGLLKWPVIKPFIQGICDTMGLDVLLDIKVLKLDPDSSCSYHVFISEK
ncbi:MULTISPECIES: hypothetical protein [Chryseobacterium]|jgi:hypothetical protein|uniref:Haem-NO-binding n=1 Tax=Chryseobacterium cucumeris TaxID=1813611 RepID=A0ABX9X687_9FLAO|nr:MULTISPECIES: hypothetical protein [Chryseobacterium]KYH05784.1 hypothetical protein A1704_11875 [Chryseobacterium cucumeris]MDH5032361.1 hypothetical protein [Chryseobacterium cucumeris]QWT86010.1 hypothetical protein KBP46_21675 [Chryseobacterium sp. PCH239]ROH90632.1 hypothetical protein EGI15_18410 [Chryseobacterium cucumeris]TXI97090.1 MAG: hypothetical protein E6Q35_06645 [Chryseobacterium cucumeris]